MLNEQEPEALKRAVEEAWTKAQNHQYEKIEPRFYKEKRGRKMELINPWKSLKERNEIEGEGHTLYWEYQRLAIDYHKLTGEDAPVSLHFKRVETPSGDRYVRRSDL